MFIRNSLKLSSDKRALTFLKNTLPSIDEGAIRLVVEDGWWSSKGCLLLALLRAPRFEEVKRGYSRTFSLVPVAREEDSRLWKERVPPSILLV